MPNSSKEKDTQSSKEKKTTSSKDLLFTPYGSFLLRGEPSSALMLRIYNKMVAVGQTNIYEAGEHAGLSKEEVDALLTKDEYNGQLQSIKNQQRFQRAEDASDVILSLKDSIINENGKIDKDLLSQVRQHAEFVLERVGKDKGFSKSSENIQNTLNDIKINIIHYGENVNDKKNDVIDIL